MNKLYPKVLPLFLVGILLLAIAGCKKEKKNINLPELTTNEASIITQTTAYCGGNIIADGGDIITERGICISTTQNPTIADKKIKIKKNWNDFDIKKGRYRVNITALTPKTTYYIRAYATNSVGTAYGNEKSFFTDDINETLPMKDYDGNSYKTVKIENQIWMAINLRTTSLNDGTIIPNVTDDTKWKSLNTAALCTYGNTTNTDTIITLGRLYNGYAVKTEKLCPIGWHVPSHDDWDTLVFNLEGEDLAGGKLKEEGYKNWDRPNLAADNESGFSAVGAGLRCENYSGVPQFAGYRYSSGIWSSTFYDNIDNVPYYFLNNLDVFTNKSYLITSSITSGYSVRCIKD
jgi:uncharacterized protein (TIGR02145 family)